MGGDSSKVAKQPDLKPWREIDWDEGKDTDLRFLKSYKPQTQIRVLLHGPNGAGKSSFINSVQSTLLGRPYVQALVDNISNSSFTKQYKTFKIQKGDPGTFYPFVFNDIMGLEAIHGVLEEDVKQALKGHVKNGYLFNPADKISQDKPSYNETPDKVHVLVLVINATPISSMKDGIKNKIKGIIKEATDLGIPQVAIVTKIDKICAEVEEDLKNIYKIQKIQKDIEKLSEDTRIPMDRIFPVKNYHEEIHVDHDTDTLILNALREIITVGGDHIKSFG